MTGTRIRRGAGAWLRAAVAGVVVGLMGAGATGQTQPQPGATAPAAKNKDILIFRDGKTLEGQIVSEDAKTIRLKGELHGIAFEYDYAKSDVLEIKRGAGGPLAPESPKRTVEAAPVMPGPETTPAPATSAGGERVYWLELTGKFGEDITQTPLRAAMKDAKAQKASTIVMVLNNQMIDDRMIRGNEELEQLVTGGINDIFRAEDFMPVVIDEVPEEWRRDNMEPPKFVYWVRRALGGLCYLPLTSQHVYFHPEGILGGVGNLNDLRRMGHIRVTEKQISLRRGHAIGWVLQSGYPQAELLVRALMQDDFVMSVRIEGGKPVLFEGFPTNPGEELLTDDGEGINADTIDQAARGLGNDVLTLNERTAKLIGVSRGTVETREELLVALGLRPEQIVKGRSEQVLRDWSKGLDSARGELRRLIREIREIEIQGTWEERRAARSSRISKLEQMKGLFARYQEALDPRWMAQNGIPRSLSDYTELQDRLRTEQMLDKKK